LYHRFKAPLYWNVHAHAVTVDNELLPLTVVIIATPFESVVPVTSYHKFAAGLEICPFTPMFATGFPVLSKILINI
jgi:hypothetical protein